MTSLPKPDPRPFAPGIILALLAIGFGFVLGGLFGGAEDSIKDHLLSSADAVVDSVYDGDEQRRDAVVSKSWVYLKRAHMHAGAIGSAALASILLLGLFGASGRLERVSSLAFGAGALIYPAFWLTAGLCAPGVGSTGAAKESLQVLAIPGAGLCLVGVFGTLASVVKQTAASHNASD
jgi:hypothetical protein